MTYVRASRLRPKHDYVLIERDQELQTEGGVLLPERGGGPAMHGRVLRVGPGLVNQEGKRVQLEAKVGEYVFFTNAPDLIEVGTTHVLVRDYCVASSVASEDVAAGDTATLEDLEEVERAPRRGLIEPSDFDSALQQREPTGDGE